MTSQDYSVVICFFLISYLLHSNIYMYILKFWWNVIEILFLNCIIFFKHLIIKYIIMYRYACWLCETFNKYIELHDAWEKLNPHVIGNNLFDRRFVWNFFRLENEHLNNCGKFRAVRDISVAPVDCSDQTQILRMMDTSDGVINRRRKQKVDEKRKPIRLLLMGESLMDD